MNPNKRLSIYFNYGGDYIGRDYATSGGKQIGYGTPSTDMSGCDKEAASGGPFSPANPAHCGGNNKDVQEFTAGYWYNIYSGPQGRLRYGLQYSRFERDLWSGTGGTTNPSNERQWGGQHVLDVVPLLPAVNHLLYELQQKGQPLTGCPSAFPS